MPTNDYEPHPFINRIACPPWPKSVHTDALDAARDLLPGILTPGNRLPKLVPTEIRMHCHDCGYIVPCAHHSKLVELMHDTGIISRQGGKTNNGTGKSDSSDT